MSRSYAEGTKVAVGSSQAEIMGSLAKFGVKQRAFYDDEEGQSAVGFSYGGLSYRIAVLMPRPEHDAFWHTAGGRRKNAEQARAAYDAEVRRRWRSLVLAVKAKLVAVDDEISTFEQEFLAYVVTGDGKTVAEHLIPALKQGAREGRIPASLPVPGAGR